MIYTPEQIPAILSQFKADDVIVYPTDTVYGIGASFSSAKGVDKIFEIKQRPLEKSLIILCANEQQLVDIVGPLSPIVKKYVEAFLPGGLTLILKPQISIINEITRGKESIGVRIPNHPVALALLEQLGPLATTSANVSGEDSPTEVDIKNPVMVNADFTIDGGETLEKIPSTILDCTQDPPKILREGSITQSMLDSIG